MRMIDVIVVLLIWLFGACASTGTVVDDLQFDGRMVAFQEAYWHIQTNSRPDSVSWVMTNPLTMDTYAYQKPVKLRFISMTPYTAKGAYGTLRPEQTGRFKITFHIWGRWIDEEISVYRNVYQTDQMWESLDLERIKPARP